MMDNKKVTTLVLCSVIIAIGIIIGAAIYSNALAERPLVGSFSGSLSSSDGSNDIMDTGGLMSYLAIYPQPSDADYDAEISRIKTELQSNILSGKWPDFPYVSLSGRLYFSKQAVDEWFSDMGKTRLEA